MKINIFKDKSKYADYEEFAQILENSGQNNILDKQVKNNFFKCFVYIFF